MSRSSDKHESSISQIEKEEVQFCDLSSEAVDTSTDKDSSANVADFFIFPIPERLRYRKDKPFQFNYALTIAFSCSGAICALPSITNEIILTRRNSDSKPVLLPTAAQYVALNFQCPFRSDSDDKLEWVVAMASSFNVSNERVSRYAWILPINYWVIHF